MEGNDILPHDKSDFIRTAFFQQSITRSIRVSTSRWNSFENFSKVNVSSGRQSEPVNISRQFRYLDLDRTARP
jgi:hypothetical protein